MLKIGLAILVFIVILATLILFWPRIGLTPTQNPRGVICTKEAKLCPDGSAGGREGPNCEFAACPATN